MVNRILGHANGGPLDDQFFSVPAENDTIEGFNDMPDGSTYLKRDEPPAKLTSRELALVRKLFDTDQHKLTETCEFDYHE